MYKKILLLLVLAQLTIAIDTSKQEGSEVTTKTLNNKDD